MQSIYDTLMVQFRRRTNGPRKGMHRGHWRGARDARWGSGESMVPLMRESMLLSLGDLNYPVEVAT